MKPVAITITCAVFGAAALVFSGCASTKAIAAQAERSRSGVTVSADGADAAPGTFWVTQDEWNALEDALAAAKTPAALKDALAVFNNAKKTDGTNPYNGAYPGPGPERVAVASVTYDTGLSGWSLSDGFNDGRWNQEGIIEWETPFKGDKNGKLKITLNADGVASGGKAYDGVAMRGVLASPVTLTDSTFVQFDFYYPMDSQGKLMRFELWSTSTGGANPTAGGSNKIQSYVRPDSLEYLNGPVAGEYNLQTYRVKKLVLKVPASLSGKTWEDLRLDLHGETNSAWNGGVVFIDNLEILQQGSGAPIPPVKNALSGTIVDSIKAKYGESFLVGSTVSSTDTGFSPLLTKHFDTVTPTNNLKASEVHPNPPAFLTENGFDFTRVADKLEYTLDSQDSQFAAARAAGLNIHGHVLAWFNQGAPWMTQIVPEHIESNAYNARGEFYLTGNGAVGPFFKVPKDLARRAYFNHVVHELRHFMTADPRYTDNRLKSGAAVIPFASFDVLNEEVHETRHTTLVTGNSSVWKTALRNTSWLMAMTDDDYKDTSAHYVYLLFKFAHIALPNAKMAAAYKANYAALPEYMKLDANDDGASGGIDAFVSEKPPVLYYNDYDLANATKARTVYNMVKELNTLWKKDPLYDGRPLIEGIGIQGHDTVSPTLASRNQAAIALFSSLVDQGLLSAISISELDLNQPDSAPGGAASSTAGDILNQTQADALGYQFALLWKVYLKYSKYIERVTFWGTQDPGWGGSYKIFDAAGNAAPGYYGVMDSDAFIQGHSYLDAYFDGEYNRIR